jgi:hypothetical protein
MLKEYTNPKIKGTVGVGQAIAYFTRHGIIVSIPLNDSQPYDLVADIDGELKRIQVKTTTSNVISLRTTGGNQSFHTAKLFEHNSCDFIYGMLDNGESWLIPTSAFTNINSIKLTDKKYEQYKIV